MSISRRKKHKAETFSGKNLFNRIIFVLIIVDIGMLLLLYGAIALFPGKKTVITMPRVIGLFSIIIAAGSVVFTIAIYYTIKKSFHYVQVIGQQMQHQIDEDVLTEASSRRKGMRLLEAEYIRQHLLGQFDSVVIMVDIDNFKSVNDNFGHSIGDKALQDVVFAIQGVSRKADDIIRWGGDEFIGIYRGMTEKNSEEMRKRLQDVLTDICVDTEKGPVLISASFGMSFFKESDETYMDVLKRADDALYAEKKREKKTDRNG